MDFSVLPPEVNSSLMYSGPGSGPMLAAASAWRTLAADLESAAASYESLVSNLISEPWLGPAAATMAAAVTPYVAWMHATAGQAAYTATQVHAAAAAYEAAFAATVPPPVVIANRTLLLQLIATNLLGQNTAAIAAAQAEYAQMWAQDAAAMYGYSASSAAATQLTPFTPPGQATNPGGEANQAAATAHAAGNAAGNTATDTAHNALSAAPQTLQQLAQPVQALPAQPVPDPGVDAAVTTGIPALTASSAYHTAIGSANFFQRVASQFQTSFATSNAPSTTDLMDRMNRIGLATGAITEDEVGMAADGSPLGTLGLGGFGDWHSWERFFKGLGGSIFHSSATAGMGQAQLVGGLSVPQNWAAAAPEIKLAVAESASAGVDAAPAAGGGGMGSVGAQAALAGMAGRALAGAFTPGGRDGARSTSRQDKKLSADAAKEIATALREYASLRDSGIITDTEFNKHKERLMSLDPLSGGTPIAGR